VKHLPKHLRPRWRYLAVGLESWPDADVGRGDVQRELWFAASNLLGDPGNADADLSVVSFDFDDGVGHAVVRVRRGEVERARAALACVDDVDGAPLALRVRGVSGTLRACEEKYIRGPTEPTHERTVAFADADRRAFTRDSRLDVRVGDGYVGATHLDI
jgi:ribonuclease P/MRP protein subunit POP5